MSISSFGLVVEILLFALGLYAYLFARGFIRWGSPEVRARSEAFRKENAVWLRWMGLALAAVMAVNVGLHLLEMIG